MKVIVVAVVIVLASGGTALALELTGGHHAKAKASPGRARTAGQHASPSQPVPGTPTGSSQQPSSSVPPSSSGVTVNAASGVAGDPNEPSVQSLLTSYFTAINNRDYMSFISLFDPQFQQNYSQGQFDSDYSSTTDSAITLTGISAASGGNLNTTVTFTSHQNPSQSPDNASCDNWTITLYLEQQASGYLIGNPDPGYQPQHSPC